jgi:hypothetical protein
MLNAPDIAKPISGFAEKASPIQFWRISGNGTE